MSISELEHSVWSLLDDMRTSMLQITDIRHELYLTLRIPIRECDTVRLLSYKAALDAVEGDDRT